MKKFLLLIQLLFVCTVVHAQSDSYSSNIFTDSPISLSSGHYSFNLPLFNMETPNSQVQLNASLGYHSKSVRSIYSGSMFGNGFSLSILPVISRENASDEDKLPSLTINANGVNDRPDIYTYNLLGLNGKFFVYVKNGVMKVQVVEQNTYAEIKVKHDTGSGFPTQVSSYQNMYFIIVDKDGTEYVFSTKENRPYQISSTPVPRFQNRFLNIYLTKIIDKSKRELVSYTYTDRTVGDNTLKQIYEINAPNYGKVRFNILNSTNVVPRVQNIQLFNEFNTLERTIEFLYGTAHLGTYNLSKITYKTPDNKTYYYQLFYNNNTGTLDDSGYYWPNSTGTSMLPYGMSYVSEFASTGMLSGMTSGALSKVILPTGGNINFTYEVNDMKLDESKWYTDIPDNYDFAETPKIVSTIYRTEGLFTPYVRHSFTVSEKVKLYYMVNSDGKSSGGSLPIVTYPDYKIYKSPDTTTPILSTKASSSTAYSNMVLDPGTYYLEYKDSEKSLFKTVSLKIHTKKTANLQQYVYAPGIRIKSIVEQQANKTKSETVFHYKPLTQLNEKVSSGYTGYAAVYSKIGLRYLKDKNKEFVYYTTVTKEIKGKGFIEYHFGDKVLNDSLVLIGKFDNLRKYPKQIKQYDAAKNLTEEISNDYTFEYIPMEMDASIPYVKPQGILKKQVVNAKNYKSGINVGNVDQIVEYSTDFRMPLTETVDDVKNGETVKLESTYQKVGSEVLLTSYKKTLNNNMLFNKTYNYVLKMTALAEFYPLTSYAEKNSQNEIVNSYEVTKTDINGNVLEYKDHLGIFHSIVWGYNNSKKLFEVTDLKYDQINTLVISDLQLYTSSSGTAQFQDPTIISGYYATLRNAHPDKLITTYTYNIGKGLRTVTDPNGRTTFYEYDNFGRLKNMKDQEGNFIKSYQYNFINGVN